MTCSNPPSKHVLFLESSKNIGGQELQLLQQQRELQAAGWSTELLCKPSARVAEFARAQNLAVTEVAFRNAIHLPSIMKVIGRVLATKARVLVCHSGHDAVVAALASKLLKVFFLKVRVLRMRTYQPGMPSAFPYNHLFDHTYTPSQYLKNQLLANPKINSDRISVLYPGIDFEQLEKASADLPPALILWLKKHIGPVIAHGAMLRGEKGHATILRALPRVLEVCPGVRYVVAGEGPEILNLQLLTEQLGIQEHVYFAGLLPSMAGLLRISSMAVLPSLQEPLGMFQIEAQYLKVPTLASRVGGIPETILHQETGLLIPPGDVSAWAEHIIWALQHLPTMQRWAESGRDFVSNRFSMVNNTEQLLLALEGS